MDFALVNDQKVEKIIEVKQANSSIDTGLKYFYEKLQTPAVQVVKELKRERVEEGNEVQQGLHFLRSLYL